MRNLINRVIRILHKAYLNVYGYDVNRRLDRLEMSILDIKRMLSHKILDGEYRVDTSFPFAYSSSDFRKPRGSAEDFTRCPAFVYDCMSYFGGKVKYLDLGCANGGLVYDFILEGNKSFGLDGSDFGMKNRTQHWRVIPNALGNADLSKPFNVILDQNQAKFDVIGAWEVLEHIKESDLAAFLKNVSEHLEEGGVFMASVAQFPDFDPMSGEVWHVTIQEKSWWEERFKAAGFREIEIPEDFNFPRGGGNPTVYDWDVKTHPEKGFHVFLSKSN